MRSVFLMSGNYLLLSSLIVSLSYHPVKTSEINAFNLCTRRHCEDCSNSEFLRCANGAILNSCGDLCGCCHSCVQLRDIGESCGSQLAVRSSENFDYSRSRVTVLATTSCNKGLICKNFACKSFHDKVNFQDNDEDTFDLRTNLITKENSNEDYRQNRAGVSGIGYTDDGVNDSDIVTRKIELNEILSTIESQKNEISRYNSELDVESSKNILLDPSRHLINLLVTGREFQLIYGYKALADLDLLIKSIDKNQPNSIFKEYGANILFERFKDVLEFVNSNREESIIDWGTELSSMSLKIENKFINKNLRYPEAIRDPGVITVLRNFVLNPRTSKISKSRGPVRKFRKKRELDEAEKSKVVVKVDDEKNERQGEIDEKNQKEYNGDSVYDIVNKTPRQIEDFGHWLIARKVEINPEEKLRADDEIESEINIHITGIPRMINFGPEEVATEEKDGRVARTNKTVEGYEINDDLDIFVSDANTRVPKFTFTEDNNNLANLTTSDSSENEKNIESERYDNITEQDWKNGGENIQYFTQFTFPENPVTSVNDTFRDFEIFVNETVDEFRSQLDRIETKAIIIENALFDMMKKIEVNERSQDRVPNSSSFEIVEPDKLKRFVGNLAIPRQRKIIHSSNENSSDLRYSLISPEFSPNRLNRQWRTLTIQPDLVESPKISISRRRPNRSEENKIIDPQVTHRQSILTRNREDSHRRNEEPLPSRSGSIKLLKDLPKVLEQRKFPIFLSNRNSNGANFHNQNDPRLFSQNEQSSLEVKSGLQRSGWPLNLILNRALSEDKSKRRSEERIKSRGTNLNLEDPMVEESVILLETQIPKSIIRPPDSMTPNDQIGGRSTKLLTKYVDDDDWNWEDDKSSLNLFVVDEENSDFGVTSSRLGLPEDRQESHEIDDSYSIFPAYLDYSETKKREDGGNGKAETTESSNSGKSRQTIFRSNRKKRNVVEDFLQMEGLRDGDKKESMKSGMMIHLNSTTSSSNTMKSSEKLPYSENTESRMKNSSGKRSRRSVKMVDWLRAAQEYHERLRQVRNAAVKTWLATREELDDANLTNVKLFTREIPSYLERYTPKSYHDDYGSLSGEESQESSAEIRDPEDSMVDISEVLTDISSEQASPRENDSEPEMNETVDDQFSELSSSSGPRKFTIITDGNSTIRIEEILADDDVAWFEDQSAQGSTGSEIFHELPITISDSDYFDHMYESLEADDEDFDYDDPNYAMSGWLDQVDMIESSSVEVSKEQLPRSFDNEDKYEKDEKEEKNDDPSSRYKRDSPLFLFKVKGKPQNDVLVWPSNWRDLIERHLRLNRSRDEPRATTKRRSYGRIAKIDPKLLPAVTLRTNVEKTPHDEIPSSSEILISEERTVEDSRIDLEGPRKLQKIFDHRSRQGRRRNGKL